MAPSRPVKTVGWNPVTGILNLPGSGALNKETKNLEPDIPGLTGVAAIGDFASRLTEKNTWLRAGEFAVGVVLLYVGLKAMFPGAVSTVTSAPRKAAKLGALAA
jgi:hypothetical protein